MQFIRRNLSVGAGWLDSISWKISLPRLSSFLELLRSGRGSMAEILGGEIKVNSMKTSSFQSPSMMFKYVHTTNPIEEIPIMEPDTADEWNLERFPHNSRFSSIHPRSDRVCLLCHRIFVFVFSAGMQFNSTADRSFSSISTDSVSRNSKSWWWSDYQLLSAVKTQLFNYALASPRATNRCTQYLFALEEIMLWRQSWFSEEIANWVGTWCSLRPRMPRTFLHKLSNNSPFVCTSSKQLLQPAPRRRVNGLYFPFRECYFFSSRKLVIGVCIAFSCAHSADWWVRKFLLSPSSSHSAIDTRRKGAHLKRQHHLKQWNTKRKDFGNITGPGRTKTIKN